MGDVQKDTCIADHGITHRWCFTGLCTAGWESASLLLLWELTPSSQGPQTICLPEERKCKCGKGMWEVWALREENNIQMLRTKQNTTSENTSTILFCLRYFLGKPIRSEVLYSPISCCILSKACIKGVFLPPPSSCKEKSVSPAC